MREGKFWRRTFAAKLVNYSQQVVSVSLQHVDVAVVCLRRVPLALQVYAPALVVVEQACCLHPRQKRMN